jgi:hypothetical protein
MVSLSDPVCKQVSKKLSAYDKSEVLAAADGLLTVPKFSANPVFLIHLSLFSCNGGRKITRSLFKQTLNEIMGGTNVASAEEPVDDELLAKL